MFQLHQLSAWYPVEQDLSLLGASESEVAPEMPEFANEFFPFAN